MIPVIVALAIVGIISGPLLAGLGQVGLKRSLGWLLLSALVAAAHAAVLDAEPFWRMVALCGVLLGSMKGVVYAEWAGPEKLPLSRYFVFSFCWFGMDPASFKTRRRGLAWKTDVAIGLVLAVIGAAGAWWVATMEWRHVLVMFSPPNWS